MPDPLRCTALLARAARNNIAQEGFLLAVVAATSSFY
jgi:hypothetical protein